MLTSNLKQSIRSILSLSLLIAASSHAAAVHEPTTEPVNVIAPYAISNSYVGDVDNPAKAYRPWFENGAWQGELVEYDISSSGVLSTSIDLSTSPPTNSVGGSNWSARIQFNTAVAAAPTTYWNTGREIIFYNGTAQKPFRYDELSVSQKAALSSDNLDYVRGDQSNEIGNTNGTLRKRYNLLGDIIHSNPVYVAKPDANFTSLLGYSTFQTTYQTRAARVYVGANDGMLHAFDASTGNEVWAYVPSMIINNLSKLSAQPFVHTYFVDGQLAEGDMDFAIATDSSEWHSILAGGLGSGAKGFFILDITNPNLSDEAATTGTDIKVLHEFDGSDADIGHIHGKAQIARLNNNQWVVLTGNGYGSTNGEAKLLMIDKDGNVTKLATDGSTANGLSDITLVDTDNDSDIDFGYAGDLQGNLWKFDFTNFVTGTPLSIVVTKLFAAGSDKPITTAPDIRRHPTRGYLIYFGTGSLLSDNDAASTTQQSIYGIWDGAPVGNTNIITQTLATGSYTYTDDAGTPADTSDDIISTLQVRTTTDGTNTYSQVIDWAVDKGWKVDLNISGERLVTRPIIRADRLQFVTHNPLTGSRGDAWLLQFHYLDGGTGPGVFLDLNQDGSLNDSDKESGKIPVGINLGNGSFSEPEIARVTNDRDTMYINGLFLAFTPKCTDGCSFQGGHVDVTSDSPSGVTTASTASDSYCFAGGDRTAGIPVDANGDSLASPFTNAVSRAGGILVTAENGFPAIDGFGDSVDGYVKSYDEAHGQVYVDYINLEPLCSQPRADSGASNPPQDIARITEVGIDYDKKFFAIIANADFSIGSTFQLGAKKWNVLIYQKLIQEKLDAWKAAGANVSLDAAVTNSFAAMMVDADGDSLLYSINSILAADAGKGTMRHSFNSLSIISGGLMLNNRDCVMKSPEENFNPGNNTNNTDETGRWRGGALVTHLIGVTEYLADTSTVVAQVPTDLFRKRVIDGVEIPLKIDTSGDGNYDTYYGGLRARYRVNGNSNNAKSTNPAFLYETTLHWEYSGSCYGSQNWSSDANGAANSNSTTALHSQVLLLNLDLEAAKIKLQAMIDAGENENKIAKQRALIAALEARIQEILDAQEADSIENTGTPSASGETNTVIAPSLGPNFQTGQRTWIDLTP